MKKKEGIFNKFVKRKNSKVEGYIEENGLTDAEIIKKANDLESNDSLSNSVSEDSDETVSEIIDTKADQEPENNDVTNLEETKANIVEQSTDKESFELLSENNKAINFSVKSDVKINKFDIFFVKVWAFIVSFITKSSTVINKLIRFVFKKAPPLKYTKAVVSTLLIVLLIVLVTSPFRIQVNETKKYDVFGDKLIPYKVFVGNDTEGKSVYLWGYVDKEGREKIKAEYINALPFMYGVAFVKKRKIDNIGGIEYKKEYWVLINKKGKERGDLANKNIEEAFSFNVEEGKKSAALVKIKNEGYGFVNRKGQIIRKGFEDASQFKQGRARVKGEGREYFINNKGQTLIDTYNKRYKNVRSFNSGLAAVQDESNLWGFVNAKGKEVIPCRYSKVGPFLGSYAKVLIGGKISYVDKNGNEILPPQIDIIASTPDFEKIVLKPSENDKEDKTTYIGYYRKTSLDEYKRDK